MPMMASQILRSVDFTETQKSMSRERKQIFLQLKKSFTNQGLLYGKKIVL